MLITAGGLLGLDKTLVTLLLQLTQYVRTSEPDFLGTSSHLKTFPSSSSATTVLPGQDKLAPSAPISVGLGFVVYCGVRLSEVGFGEIRKPQVAGSIPVAGSIILQRLPRATRITQLVLQDMAQLDFRAGW
jgi:hypothetical protein